MKIVYADAIFDELVDLSFYIAKDDKNAAQRFLKASEKALELIKANPYIGRRCFFDSVKLQTVKAWRIKGFENYIIYYVLFSKNIKVLHISHSSRSSNIIIEQISHEYPWGEPMGMEVW